MQPTSFPQQNGIWGESQPPYIPLPAYTGRQETVTCWQLTLAERVKLLVTGRLWLRQLNFGRPLQPQLPSVVSPFLSADSPTEAVERIVRPADVGMAVVDN